MASSSARPSRSSRPHTENNYRPDPHYATTASYVSPFGLGTQPVTSSSDHTAGFPSSTPRVSARLSPSRSAMPSVEDMYNDYVSNKVELTKHVSAAAGAVEKLWGGDGWYLRWYETPIPSGNESKTNAGDATSANQVGEHGAASDMPLEISNDADLVVVRNDITSRDIHNLVEHVNIPTQVTPEAVKMIFSRFESQNRLFSWVIGPWEQPLLETMLRSLRLWCEELAPTLSVDLDHREDLFCSSTYKSSPGHIQDSAPFPSPGSFQLSSQPVGQFLNPMSLRSSEPRQTMPPPPPRRHFRPVHGLDPTQEPGMHGRELRPGSIRTRKKITDPVLSVNADLELQTTVGAFENLSLPVENDSTHSLRDERLRILPDGTFISLLLSKDQVEEWVRTWAYQADFASASIEHWTGIYSKLIETLSGNQFRMFAARKPLDSSSGERLPSYKRPTKLIGTGYVHLYSGVVSIHCITVLPEYRSKGFGSALIRYGMGIGKEMGYSMAMLTGTSSIARSTLFSGLGFKEFGRVKLYVYRPLPVPETAPTPETKRIQEAESDGWEWVGEDDEFAT